MVKVKSIKYFKNEFANQTISFPIIGDAAFDANSILEVDEDKLEEFIEATKDSFNFEEIAQNDESEINDVEPKKRGPKPKNVDPELEETIKMINMADTQTLLALAGETKDEAFMIKAAGMTDEKLRKELLKKLTK